MPNEMLMSAKRIFMAKRRTGLYNHYSKKELRILYLDCLGQAILSEVTQRT